MNEEKLENESFVDEIHENNIVLENKKDNRKLNILLICIFILLLLFSTLFLLYRKGIIVFNNTYHLSHNLFVVHSKTAFGDTINDFSSYTNYDNAYSYTFSVHNSSDKKLFYNISLVDLNHNGSDDVNKKQVNYALLKNSELLFKGMLSSKKENVLASQEIYSNVVDNYEIRIWSSSDVSGSLEFKININN